jgi:ribosomal protein L7/L12
MIKVELEVSDLLALTAKAQADEGEIARLRQSNNDAWRQVDLAQETIANLKRELDSARSQNADRPGCDAWVAADACRSLMNATHNGQKIDAIKAVRTLTHYGLREAKDLVEEHPTFKPALPTIGEVIKEKLSHR